MELIGTEIALLSTMSWEVCAGQCKAMPDCEGWNFKSSNSSNVCTLLTAVNGSEYVLGTVSGDAQCGTCKYMCN